MLRAEVWFSCEGGFPERFLNEAARRDIVLRDVSTSGLVLRGRCRASHYARLRPAAKAASVRMRVTKRCGLPFVLRPWKHRVGIFLGLVLFVTLLTGFSSRIWMIRVSGNTELSDNSVLEAVRSLGVYEGGDFQNINIPQLQLAALEKLPSLTWLSVHKRGCVAYVEVRETSRHDPIADTAPANVIAACDGVIVQIDAVCGQASVKVGDAVTAGSLLISGVVDSKVGPLLKRAEGTVKARTTRTVRITVPLRETVPSPTPRTVVRPALYVLGWQIPLYTSGDVEGNYTATYDRYPVYAYGQALPLGLTVERYVFSDEVCVERTSEQAREEAYRRLEAEVGAWEGRVIESHTVNERKTDTVWEVCGTYTCLEEIGMVQPLQMDEKSA